jgi:CheY-like chemotaxis protein
VDAESLTPLPESHLSTAGIRVILVDDEADVRGAVAGLLERAGAAVLPLESGASIELALSDFRPDVLVLDIGMPGEDGYALIRRIRRLPKASGGGVPAISLTAHARDEDRRHALDLGFQAHLAKPVNVAQLLTTIRQLASDSAPRSSAPAVVSAATTVPDA